MSGLATHRRRLLPPSFAAPCRRQAVVGFAASSVPEALADAHGLRAKVCGSHPGDRTPHAAAKGWYKVQLMSNVIPRDSTAQARQKALLGGPSPKMLSSGGYTWERGLSGYPAMHLSAWQGWRGDDTVHATRLMAQTDQCGSSIVIRCALLRLQSTQEHAQRKSRSTFRQTVRHARST